MSEKPDQPRDYLLGVLLPESVKGRIAEIAKHEARSLSLTGYLLILKGLDGYEKDHELRSPRNLPLKRSSK